MKSNRRKFISKAVAGGLAVGAVPLVGQSAVEQATAKESLIKSREARLDEILRQPVLKKELFGSPVIIETLELLKYDDRFICRVRSSDGAEGISVAHYDMALFYPIFNRKLHRFFVGKDARDLDLILERVLFYGLNFRLGGIALGIPLATIEFAILDMLGHISNKSVGQLIGEVHNPEVAVYAATEFRHLPLEEHFEQIQKTVAQYDVNALKIKVGYMHYGTTDIHYPGIPGKSEKLIPMVREHYGDDMFIYADSNGYYDVEGAIKIGKLLEAYRYSYFEEPVMFDHFEDIKKENNLF